MFLPIVHFQPSAPAAPLPVRQHIARGFLASALLIGFLSLLVVGFCWPFYAAMAVCAVGALGCGSRRQRWFALALLVQQPLLPEPITP